jgi:hypothetical protein
MKVSWSVGGNNFNKTFNDLSLISLEDITLSLGTISLPDGPSAIAISVEELNGEVDSNNNNSDTIYNMARTSYTEVIPLREDFDNNSFNNWTVINPKNGLIWDLESGGTQYTARFASQVGDEGDESWLTSPALDFRDAIEASLFFDVDYTWENQKSDRLRVLISDNCGITYQATTLDLTGSVLATSSGRIYLNLSNYAKKDSIIVAFIATNATGDNIYVDNIEFFVSEDPDPLQVNNPFSIYYNNEFTATVTFNLPEKNDIRLTVFDVMGRKTHDSTLRNVLNQTYQVELGNFIQGVYIFRFQIGQKLYTQKVLLRQ